MKAWQKVSISMIDLPCKHASMMSLLGRTQYYWTCEQQVGHLPEHKSPVELMLFYSLPTDIPQVPPKQAP